MIKIPCQPVVAFVWLGMIFVGESGLHQAFSPQSVSAQTVVSQAVTIEPAFQHIVINDQIAVASASVTLHNTTDTVQAFEVFSQDIRQVDEQGGIALIDKPQEISPYLLAQYVRLATPTIRLEPGEKKEIPISIVNQVSMSPGGHYAALVAKAVPTETTEQKVVLPALTSILLVHKEGGDRNHISLKSVQTGERTWWYRLPTDLVLRFENQGNVHMIPQGQAKITDIFGRVVSDGIVNENSLLVLPETHKIIKVELQQIRISLPIMIYTLTVQGQTKVGQVPYSYSVSALYVAPLFAFLMVLVIGMSIGILWKRHRHEKANH